MGGKEDESIPREKRTNRQVDMVKDVVSLDGIWMKNDDDM